MIMDLDAAEVKLIEAAVAQLPIAMANPMYRVAQFLMVKLAQAKQGAVAAEAAAREPDKGN